MIKRYNGVNGQNGDIRAIRAVTARITVENRQLLFDASDIDYLTAHLTPEQLRKEIHHADIEQGVAQCFGEDADLFYWEDFGNACKLALAIQKASQPKVEVREGQVSVRATKEANDIVDIISRYTKLRKAGKEYIGKCPFHRENHPSLQVNQQKQLFYCFSCQRKGDVINFVMQIENLDTKKACLFLIRGLDKLTYRVYT